MTRVCDSCQPTVDGAFDVVNKARRARDEAQGIAWKSTDLAIRWLELWIEKDNLTDDDYIGFLTDLTDETQRHIVAAPAYTLASASSSLISDEAEKVGKPSASSEPPAGQAF